MWMSLMTSGVKIGLLPSTSRWAGAWSGELLSAISDLR